MIFKYKDKDRYIIIPNTRDNSAVLAIEKTSYNNTVIEYKYIEDLNSPYIMNFISKKFISYNKPIILKGEILYYEDLSSNTKIIKFGHRSNICLEIENEKINIVRNFSIKGYKLIKKTDKIVFKSDFENFKYEKIKKQLSK